MDIWRRSWFYRLYVVGGIGGIVAATTISGLNAQPGDDAPLDASVAAVAVWVVGLLVLQGVRFWGDRGSLPEAHWTFARTGFVLVAALGGLVAAGGVLYVNGVDAAIGPLWDGGPSLPVVFAPVVVLVLVWGARVPAMVRRAVELGDEYLQSTGLRIVAMPRSTVLPTASGWLRHSLRGATVLQGNRDGRQVTVQLTAGGSLVHVAGAAEPYERSDGDARVSAGPDGVFVERRGGAGTQAWMADLLEAEGVASRAPAAAAR